MRRLECSAPGGQVEYVDAAVPGLRLCVGISGAKSFALRKRVAGKCRKLPLGRYSERLPLADPAHRVVEVASTSAS